MDRAQLEQLALQKMSQKQAVPSSSFDRAQLEQMALEKMSGAGMTQIDPETEASLGFANRAKYSIEPIQSNRKAFLEEQYGQDNVMEKNGELYLKQDNKFVPLNKDGVSFSDFTDFAGATPEMAGGVVGTVAGAVGGGGVASIPGAIALGSAGGAVGSAGRQALSSALGTPQVASMGERASETALSGVFGGIGTGAGLAIKAGVNKAKPGITAIIKNLTKGSGDVAETVGESIAKTSSSSSIGLKGEITPIMGKQTATEITGNVADQSGRDVVEAELKNLTEIAERQGLPKPTYAQAAQGKALIAEAKVMDTPLIGGKVRKQVDEQLKVVKDNLEKITGKFIDVNSDAFEVGLGTREMAETGLSLRKKMATELYDQVEEEGADAMIGKRAFFNKYRDYAGELGLMNPDMTPAKYAADSGLTRNEFNTLQGAMFDGIDALKNNPSDKIRFEAVNALRKTVKGTVEELREKNPNAARLLDKFGRSLDDTAEGVLNREAPKLGEKFKEANRNYAIFKNHEKFTKKFFKSDMGDEKVVKSLMSDTTKINSMKDLIGEENVKTVGKTYVRDILEKLGKSGIGRADTALNEIKKNGAQIRAAIGGEAYGNLVDNLHYLNRTGQSINVSRASLYNILDNRGSGLKGFAMNIAGGAKTLAESKGTTVTKSVKNKVFETTGKVVPTTNRGASASGNILGDNSQRNWSKYSDYKGGNVSENEKEKRQRAISGGKQ